MNLSLAPDHIIKIKDVYVLWFQKSNKYIVLSEDNFTILQNYLKSKDILSFINNSENYSTESSKNIYAEVEQLLLECHEEKIIEPFKSESLKDSSNWLSKIYNIKGVILKVNYASQKILSLIHQQFAHLENTEKKIFKAEFHIVLENDQLQLFKNKHHCGSFFKADYHLLQGKFAIELLCETTDTNEADWLGAFHASTISNQREAIMLIGESGSGKSTLSAILMSAGFNLVADDFTPVLSKSQTICCYPSAISIKEGSFAIIESLFSDNSEIFVSKSPKGKIRYITPINKNQTKEIHCNKIVLVNYKKNANTTLEEVSIEKLLNILIPDSWISPIPENAAYFLNWLKQITFYELTYSDNEEVILKFQKLLNN